MERMHWTYEELMRTPATVLDDLSILMEAEARVREER